jgi:ribosomal protein S18 acetylase RimI-like enzyme
MKIRDAPAADLSALDPLKRAFESEIPEPPWVEFDIEQELGRFADVLAREIAVVAEDDDGVVVGFALARRLGRRLGLITDLYVVPSARGHRLATLLVRRVVARLREFGLDMVRLEVLATNAHARSIYAQWGFDEEWVALVVSLEGLERRLAASG